MVILSKKGRVFFVVSAVFSPFINSSHCCFLRFLVFDRVDERFRELFQPLDAPNLIIEQRLKHYVE